MQIIKYVKYVNNKIKAIKNSIDCTIKRVR